MIMLCGGQYETSMPSLSQDSPNEPDFPLWTESEWAKAFPPMVVESGGGGRNLAVRPVEAPSGPNAGGTVPDEGLEEPDYSWRRKAVQRRMRRGGEVDEAEEFTPVFTPPRVQDGAPVFELMEADLAGRVMPLRGEGARFREKAAMISANIFAVLLAAVVCAATLDAATDEALLAGVTSSVEAKREVQVWNEVRRSTSRISEAGAAVEAFLRARTPEEKMKFVRGGSAMLPAMRRYYALHPDEPEGFLLAPGAEHGTHGSQEFLFIHGTDPLGCTVETAVECTPSGVRLDWRFLTGAADMEWNDWIAQRPAKPVSLRVEAVLDDYYAGDFADAHDWICLKITDPARSSAVWAYHRRNTDDGLSLVRQLNGRRGPVRLLGVFEFPAVETPAGKSAPQVQLISVATQGWLDRTPEAAPVVSMTSRISQANDQS